MTRLIQKYMFTAILVTSTAACGSNSSTLPANGQSDGSRGANAIAAAPASGQYTPGPNNRAGMPFQAPAISLPDNSLKGVEAFVPGVQLTNMIKQKDVDNALTIRSTLLKRWSDIAPGLGATFRTINANRMVYEISSSFNKDYAIRGNHWSSGTRTFIVDAETGTILVSTTKGAMTTSAGASRLSALEAARRSGQKAKSLTAGAR